ncbi:TonB-dependent receptor plug domain-containing protein [Algicola sagamiensis]|uniref:TonB-dependent receptor plug domain-containing protein n=1 Tax=Algicola sagamiensis TaxID=163869 RepID=UPI000371768F|nr:TonB-dependent receptor [Algicola sagamiensis]
MRWHEPVVNLSFTALLFAGSSSVYASQFAQDNDEIERIQVTGSRIYQESIVSPYPLTVMDEAMIERSGAVNIGDLLNQLPSFHAGTSQQTTTEEVGAVGSNFLDLRGLDAIRTLVLVNGKRHVPGQAGSSQVDINTIPVSWIERVEVITGGASAVYGADAVTGVVNFILKERIEGVELHAQGGRADDSNFSEYQYGLSVGHNFADDKGNLGFSLEVAGQDTLLSKDRSFPSYATMDHPDNEPGIRDGVPDKVHVRDAGNYWYQRNGAFQSPDGTWYLFEPNGNFREMKLGNFFDDFRCAGDCDQDPFLDEQVLQPEYKRITANAKVQYEVSEDRIIYVEAKRSKVTGTNTGPYIFTDQEEISRDNGFISPELGKFMDELEMTTIPITKVFSDMAKRREENTRQVTQGVLGFEGLLISEWMLDVSFVWGQMDGESKNFNNLISERWAYAFDAVIDPITNQVVCRATLEAPPDTPDVEGCIPVSLIGSNTVSTAAERWATTTTSTIDKVFQNVFSASLAHPAIAELPAGDLSISFGIEHRREKSDSRPDPFIVEGVTEFSGAQPVLGKVKVSEAYSELLIPLFSGYAFMEQFDFDIAGRWADYSTSGDNFTWKLGLNWEITSSIKTRATVSKAVRAPNINELFLPQNGNFDEVFDPCDIKAVSDTDNVERRKANCQALGLSDDFESSVNPFIFGLDSGNPNLKPETSHSQTVGVVYTPDFLPDFSMAIDYWNIEIDDVIKPLSGQSNAILCVDHPTGIQNDFCAQITRDPDTGEITQWRSKFQNLAKSEASGLDIELNHSLSTDYGDLSTQLIATHLIKQEGLSFQNDPTSKSDDREELGNPKWQGLLNLDYFIDKFSVAWTTRYLDRQFFDSKETIQKNPEAYLPKYVGSVTYHDVQIGYEFLPQVKAYAGAQNAFDKDIPLGFTGVVGGTAQYDNVGRSFYAGIRYQF